MERAAGLARDDTLQTKLDKLDALLTQTWTSAQHSALFVEMLSLPNDGRYPVLELTPRQRRESTMDALVWQVEILIRFRPVLIIFEDAHWADPTSLEVVRSGGKRYREPSRAADRYLPAGIRAALDRTGARDGPRP